LRKLSLSVEKYNHSLLQKLCLCPPTACVIAKHKMTDKVFDSHEVLLLECNYYRCHALFSSLFSFIHSIIKCEPLLRSLYKFQQTWIHSSKAIHIREKKALLCSNKHGVRFSFVWLVLLCVRSMEGSETQRVRGFDMWRSHCIGVLSTSEREEDEETLKCVAIERLLARACTKRSVVNQVEGKAEEVDTKQLELSERKSLLDRLVKIAEEDNERFLLKLRERMDRWVSAGFIIHIFCLFLFLSITNLSYHVVCCSIFNKCLT